MLIPSHYNILVPLRRDRVLAYNSMSAACAIWEVKDAQIYQNIAEGNAPHTDSNIISNIINDLLYGGFIIHDHVDELSTLRQQYETQRFDSSGMVLTIAPTLACNFGCDYCFQGQDKPNGFMTEDVQDAVIGLVQESIPKIQRLHVAWYGGEPLLAPAVIEALSDRIISACNAGRVKYDAMIVTNGYKLNPEIARMLFARRVVVVQVTIDGAQEYHDQRRTLLSGRSTFAQIINNLRQVVDTVSIRIAIRINIDARNRTSVKELIDYLQEVGLANRKNFGVYFAPVEAITEGCHGIADVCMTKSEYGELETEITRYAFDAGLTPLPYPRRFRGLCGAVRPNSFVILPNGDLHKCWDTVNVPSLKIGSIFDVEAARNNQIHQHWMRWTPFENSTCKKCKILPNCAGSCAHKFLNTTQTLGEAGALPCPSWKYNIKERLVLMAERSGQLTSEDYDLAEIDTDPKEICDVPYPEELVSRTKVMPLVQLHYTGAKDL